MPYKIVPTKICSECGQVLESKQEDYCDGCNVQIDQKNYGEQVRLGFQMKDGEERKDDMVFHNLGCFQENHQKIDLVGVDCISIEYICPKMFRKIIKILSA